MNKIQKVISSVWFMLSFVVVLIGVSFTFDAIEYSMEILGTMLLCLVILAIPGFFLYKLWSDKK